MTLEVVKKGFDYLVNLTSLPHQCWKNCSEFWLDFTNEVVKKLFSKSMIHTLVPTLFVKIPDSL